VARLVDTDGTPVALGGSNLGTAVGDPTGMTDYVIDKYGEEAIDTAVNAAKRLFSGGTNVSATKFVCDGGYPTGDRAWYICANAQEDTISCPPGFTPEWKGNFWNGETEYGMNVRGSPGPTKYADRITSGLHVGNRICLRVRTPREDELTSYRTPPSGGKAYVRKRGYPKDSVDRDNNVVVRRMMVRTRVFRDVPKRRLVSASKGRMVHLEVIKPTFGAVPSWPQYSRSPYNTPSHRDYPAARHDYLAWVELAKDKKAQDLVEARAELERRKQSKSQITTHKQTKSVAVIKSEETKDNTMLYVGLGGAGLLAAR